MLGTFTPLQVPGCLQSLLGCREVRAKPFLSVTGDATRGPGSRLQPGGFRLDVGQHIFPCSGEQPWDWSPGRQGVSILGGFRETPQIACERGTSVTPHVREGKASVEAKQESILLKFL